MKLATQDQEFIEKLATSDTGVRLIKVLENIEMHYADIRNLDGISADVRIDALKMLRESLLDKLLVLSGKQEPADNDEYR